MPLSLAIIADDLTGALDAAAPFAGRGLRVQVALSPEAVPAALASGADVIAVSTGSREVEPAVARAAMRSVLAALPEGVRLFKKIDSRMKGNIAAELAVLPFTRALVAPAIPDFGRVVQDGAVRGFGVDIPIQIAPALGDIAADIPDTATDDDMLIALERSDADLMIGARGLAEALARRETGRDQAAAPPLAGPRGVLVVGSRDPITLAQVAALDGTGIRHVAAPNGVIPATDPHPLMLVQATPGPLPSSAEAVAANLARGLTFPCDTLFLTGGATAEAVLTHMGIATLHLLGECLPGIPVATSGGLTIVAKSGGFGAPDTLRRIAGMIERAE